MRLEQTVNYGSKKAVIQNLKDAGCRKEMIEVFMDHLESGNHKEQIQVPEAGEFILDDPNARGEILKNGWRS